MISKRMISHLYLIEHTHRLWHICRKTDSERDGVGMDGRKNE